MQGFFGIIKASNSEQSAKHVAIMKTNPGDTIHIYPNTTGNNTAGT